MDQIAHILELNEPIKDKAMNVLEKMIARGEEIGEARGEARGLRIGTIQTLQRVLGENVSPAGTLEKLSLDALDALAQELQAKLGR